jgi:hypothetical protein
MKATKENVFKNFRINELLNFSKFGASLNLTGPLGKFAQMLETLSESMPQCPQRLKPRRTIAGYGTTEVVP